MTRTLESIGFLLSSATRILSRVMVPLVLILFAAPFVILMFFSVPGADDFCKASLSFNTVPQPGVLAVTWMYYARWSPRWLTTLMESFVMNRFDMVAMYGWLLLLVVVLNVAALWYFFRTIFRLTPAASLLASGVFYCAWIASVGSLDQQVFWLTGAMEYNLSFCTLLVLVSLLYKPRRAVWYYIALALLSIAIPAQHEVAGTLVCAALFTGAVACTIAKRPTRHWYWSLAMALLSQIIVMLSPGTKLRALQEHRKLWDFRHLPHWVAHSFYNGFNWLSVAPILAAACCIFLLSQPERPAASGEPPPQWLGAVAVCGMIFLICESALIEVGTGTWVPDRVIAWFEFVFWLLFVCAVLAGIPELRKVQFSNAARVGAFTVLAVTLLGSTNFRKAASDLRGSARSWHALNASRLRSHGDHLEFEFVPPPHLAKPQMLTGDSGCWVNECLANYLHASTVIMDHSAEPCP